MKAGATYIIRFIQDGVGSHTISFGSAYKSKEDSGVSYVTSLPVTAAASKVVAFYCDGTNMYA
jgi:hypothetical protein